MPAPLSVTLIATSRVAFVHVNSQRAAGIRVLRGVVQHVTERLHESHAIATNVERSSVDIDVEDVVLAEDQRFSGFDRVSDDRGDLDVLFVQRNSTLRDARDVEQIVDQPIQLPRLPSQHREQPARVRVRRQGACQQLDSVSNGRKRITQLVREHRHEFVLLPVRRVQRGFVVVPLGHVANGAAHHLPFPVRSTRPRASSHTISPPGCTTRNSSE